MTEYIKVDLTEVNSLNENSQKENYKLSPVQTIHGYYVLPADILTDDAWSFAFNYLNTRDRIELGEDDFPKQNII